MKRIAALALPVLLAVPLLAVPARAEDNAQGTLTIAGKPIAITHVYAFAEKGFFDPKKQDVVVLLCDAAVAPAAVRDDFARDKEVQTGKLHCVRHTIDASGQVINFRVEDSRFHPPEGGGSTYHVFEPKTFDGKTVAGRARTTAPQKSFNDTPYSYDVTFSAAIAPMKK